MYEKPKIVVVRAVYNSKNVKVMLRRPLQSERVKVVFTLKPRFFRNGENSVNIEEQFQKLLRRLSCLNMSELIEEWFGETEAKRNELSGWVSGGEWVGGREWVGGWAGVSGWVSGGEWLDCGVCWVDRVVRRTVSIFDLLILRMRNKWSVDISRCNKGHWSTNINILFCGCCNSEIRNFAKNLQILEISKVMIETCFSTVHVYLLIISIRLPHFHRKKGGQLTTVA